MKKQHPGRILYDQFLKPIGLSQNALARELGVPPRRINEIILGKRGISADTALRLPAFARQPQSSLPRRADFHPLARGVEVRRTRLSLLSA